MMSVPRLIPCLVVNDALQHPVLMMLKGTGKGKIGECVFVYVLKHFRNEPSFSAMSFDLSGTKQRLHPPRTGG